MTDTTCTAIKHGDANAYTNYRCRCTAARADVSRKRKLHLLRVLHNQPRLVDATGTSRRLRALMWLGWPTYTLAEQLDITRWTIGDLAGNQYRRINRDLAARVAALYDRLSMTPGGNAYARGKARAKGYEPPLAWDDDTIDDPTAQPAGIRTNKTDVAPGFDHAAYQRMLAGDWPWNDYRNHRAERLAAVAYLHRHGMTIEQIAARIHRLPRQVSRDLYDLGLNKVEAAA